MKSVSGAPGTIIDANPDSTPVGEETLADGGGGGQAVSAPPRKQARTTKSKRSKKSKDTSLLGILKLPTELFAEVMRNLKPVDILNLARTCKLFRNILMRRSSEPIWKRAAENLFYVLPPPPPWLDMPQYISVVFTNSCSACGGKPFPKQSKWDPEFQPTLLVRLCVACQPNVDIPQHLKPLVTITHVNIFRGPDIEMASGEYGLRAEVQKIQKELQKCAEVFHNQDELEAWVRARRGEIHDYSRRPHWDLIEYVEQDRDREKYNTKHQFKRSVEKRLTELGWEHDIDYADGKFWSLIEQPRSLTDRIWKNLYPKLQPFLEEARSQRLVERPLWQQRSLNLLWKDKHHDLGTRINVHTLGDAASKPVVARLVPPASEAMHWPLIKQILDSCPTARRDTRQEISKSWEEIRPLVETWQRNTELQLKTRLQENELFTSVSDPNTSSIVVGGQPVSHDLDVLLRADSVFRFIDNTVRYFPDDFLEIWSLQEMFIIAMDGLSVTNPQIVEGAQSFTLARKQAMALLQCLGYPNASHLAMSACGRRFVCGICVGWKHGCTKVYDWKGLLGHYISAQLNEPEPDDAVLDPTEDSSPIYFLRTLHYPGIREVLDDPLVYVLSVDDARKYAQDASTLIEDKPWLGYIHEYACLHCTDCSGLDLPTVLAHVRYTHYIMEPKVRQDYENYEVYVQQSLRATYEYAA
ncbi:unnamed protein product [Rhizoctonia solani]|uniref:F-box domain-containing protein n=1 Tax=Rhizoctonia solani TaxID=456999 RepID=A0A8H3DUG6_9AGAM|nr:unnamed protein product [Rhizoctonia solani]